MVNPARRRKWRLTQPRPVVSTLKTSMYPVGRGRILLAMPFFFFVEVYKRPKQQSRKRSRTLHRTLKEEAPEQSVDGRNAMSQSMDDAIAASGDAEYRRKSHCHALPHDAEISWHRDRRKLVAFGEKVKVAAAGVKLFMPLCRLADAENELTGMTTTRAVRPAGTCRIDQMAQQLWKHCRQQL